MSGLLRVVGVLSFIITVLTGVFTSVVSDSILVFLACFVSAGVQTIVYFAVARILDNQDDMKWRLYNIEQHFELQKRNHSEKVICESCGKNYEADRASCPYCGHKN